ncbi:MAG TPA: TIGR01777 family protein [Candidatus Thioglobus autotrophicus]|nr:TIGR01777 family protein [Candidatus Thioglobus sp.]HIL03174.1 TIGR01777 family protein [Candidatus Thioglobus autotrophicus]
MKILILGGTGLIGGALERHLSADHEVECVGRSAFASQDVLNKLAQDKDLIIKLSGANIVKRWNAAYKQEIWDSRIETSKQLKIALDFLTNKPRIFCASAVGFYPESLCDQPFNEDCKHPGTGFLSDLVVAWEKSSESLAKEVLIFRFGVVLSVKGGALSQMLLPFKLGFGGPVAGGKQCFSWIHVGDLVKAFSYAIEHPEMQGVFNLTSPNPVTQAQFGKTLASLLHRPFLLPLFKWQIKLLFGEGSQVLTQGASVVPKKLLKLGFQFDYAESRLALKDIIYNKK